MIPHRSAETEKLITALRAFMPGETKTFMELSIIVGFDVSQEIGKLTSARRMLHHEQFAVFKVRLGTIQRIEDVDVVGKTAPQYRRKAGRAALRGVHALFSVDYQALSESDQKLHNTQLAQFGAIRASLSAQTPRRLEKKVDMPSFSPGEAIQKLLKKPD